MSMFRVSRLLRFSVLPFLFAAPLAQSQTTTAQCPKVVHNAAADAALASQRWSDALKLYGDALDANHDAKSPDPTLLVGVIRSELGLGRDADGLDRVEKGIARDPQNAAAPVARAEVLYWRGDLGAAGATFAAVIKADACNAVAHFGLSRVLAAKGYAEMAFTEFRMAHQLDAADPAIHTAWTARFGDPATDISPTAASLHAELKRYNEAEADDAFLRQATDNTIKNIDAAPVDLACMATSPVTAIDQPLVAIRADSKTPPRGGLIVQINGQPLRLLLDSTANGLVLNESAAMHLKLAPSFELANGHVAIHGKVPSVISSVEAIAIGNASFAKCAVRIVRNSRVTDYDGLLGTAAFADGLIQIVYQSARFKVTPLTADPSAAPAMTRLYTMGLQGHWSSPKPNTDSDRSRSWLGFYLIDGLIAVPGKSDLWKEGLYILDLGTTPSWVLNHKTPTHYPAALSASLRIGYRNDYGLESMHAYMQRTNKDLESTEQKATSIVAIGFAAAPQASQQLDTAYLANQTGVSFKGVLGSSWVTEWNLSIDYRNRLLKMQDDKGMGFQRLTRGAAYVDETGANFTETSSSSPQPQTTEAPVGIEPRE